MNTQSKLTVAAVGILAAGALPAGADAVIYDGFDYADNSNLHNQGAGDGWLGNWANEKNGAGSALTPGLKFGSLNVAGNAAGHPLWGTSSRTIGSSLNGLLTNGATLWFSVIVDNSTGGTNKIGFALADDNFSTSNQWGLKPGATGIGIYAQDGGPASPAMWTPGALDTSLDSGSPISINPAKLIVGKIEWGAASAPETLTLYTPDVNMVQGSAVAVNSISDVNQGAFNRVSLLYKESSKIDEIRFGATYEDVVPAPSAAEPKITSIANIGGGTWELKLEGDSETAYVFRESATLEFTPGTLVENLTPGVPAVGTIGGTNDSEITTDGNGNATVRMPLSGPADFVRAVESP